MKIKGPMKMKGPTEVNSFCALCLRTYPLLSHFQNDGATVEFIEYTSTYPYPVSNSTLLELKKGEMKTVGDR